ncbi:MAG: XRE family transcriptional regulator [Actinomycetota bacterium]|nr:MAG: XRE family transcriptional regulator [Actinomycetota bacterium]
MDNQKRILGEFIKSQRKLAQLSLRELAERTNISNPYLSQIERGLHEPSVRILKSISNALNVSLGSLLSHIGQADESAGAEPDASHPVVETAIYSDPRLSQYQKEVLVASYRTFVSSSAPDQLKHKHHQEKQNSKKSKNKNRQPG